VAPRHSRMTSPKGRILLVEPAFPYPSKSRNRASGVHKNFLPIGLLKLGAYYKSFGHEVALVRGNSPNLDDGRDGPDSVLVTTLFTYWSKHVWDAVAHYRALYPRAKILIGGIYATLLGDTDQFRACLRQHKASVFRGIHPRAEAFYPDYSLLAGVADYHATHAMRGCIRRCDFCGTWRLEPSRVDKSPEGLIRELSTVGKNKVIFYDNNFLANRHVKEILEALADLRVRKRVVVCESQSGFDGRLLDASPELAELVKKARFRNVRIAWDNSFDDAPSIRRQVGLLTAAGYSPKDLSVFILYNYKVPYSECRRKLEYCAKLGVQISDCRYRPLDALADKYRPLASPRDVQEAGYHIHAESGWTDQKVRDFRRRVREHNIWIRYAKDRGVKYDRRMEYWSSIHTTLKFFCLGRPPQLEEIDASPTWRRRVALLNRAKSLCERSGTRIDLSGMSYHEVDLALRSVINNGHVTTQTSLFDRKIPAAEDHGAVR